METRRFAIPAHVQLRKDFISTDFDLEQKTASPANGQTVKLIPESAREQPFSFLAEAALFAAFFVSYLFLATLRTPASNWALAPHVLCNMGVFVLFIRRHAYGRLPLYWGVFDALAACFFIYVLMSIYYSEIRAVSWRSAGFYLDSFAAYLFGRLLFYQRLRLFAFALMAFLAIAWLRAFMMHSSLPSAPGQNAMLDEKLLQTMRVARLVFIFWFISIWFLLIPKPSNLMFLAYGAVLAGAYVLLVMFRLSWLLQSAGRADVVTARHERFETLQTAWEILRNYPLVGCGLGTFPILFEAYKTSPTLNYAASFNAYLYVIVELGIVGLALLLYFLIRFPLHILRRWRLFPNRRLRMAIFIFLCFSVLVFLQGFYDADVFSPGAWFLIWASFGILVSLVVIRDPVRIFESPAGKPEAGTGDPVAIVPLKPGMRSAFGSAPPPPTKRALTGNRMMKQAISLAVIFALSVLITVGESAPYLAGTISRRKEGEKPNSPEYGARLIRAQKFFPLSPEIASKLAAFEEGKSANPLDKYNNANAIEAAYLRAIALDPYEPDNYEKLFYLYRDTSNTNRALEKIKEGVRNNPNDFVLRMLLVRELEGIGNYSLAIFHVKEALFRIEPAQVELYLRLAELYDFSGMRSAAIRYFQYANQVVASTPQNTARLRRLRERLKLGGPDGAAPRPLSPPPIRRTPSEITITG